MLTVRFGQLTVRGLSPLKIRSRVGCSPNPQAIDEAWNEAVEQANGVPTAAAVREIVTHKLDQQSHIPRIPLHDLEGVDPDLFKLATHALAFADGRHGKGTLPYAPPKKTGVGHNVSLEAYPEA